MNEYKMAFIIAFVLVFPLSLTGVIRNFAKQYSKLKPGQMKTRKYYFRYLLWIKGFYLAKNKDTFGGDYAEVNYRKNEFWRRVLTSLWVLFFTTVCLTSISKIGYSGFGMEYGMFCLYLLITYLVLDLMFISERYFVAEFTKRPKTFKECPKCAGLRPDRWTFATTVFGKVKCHYCGATYVHTQRNRRIIGVVIAAIPAVLFVLWIYSLTPYVDIVTRIGLSILWGMAVWYLFFVIVTAIAYKGFEFEI